MLCDHWPGIEDFFATGSEILVVQSAEDILTALRRYDYDARRQIGEAFHRRALRDHTYAMRAEQAEATLLACMRGRAAALQGSNGTGNLIEEPV